jgi:AAA+ superfamily predicted ATPase
MHHEDVSGVNAFIRGIDRLANQRLPAAVIMCTNRSESLDPAVRRRAAEILTFGRPTAEQRKALLGPRLGDVGLSEAEVDAVVAATGERNGRPGFTFSDLTQRLIPGIVLDAYPNKPISAERALAIADGMTPTPAFKDQG